MTLTLLIVGVLGPVGPTLAGMPVWDGPMESAPAPVQRSWTALRALLDSELSTQSTYSFSKSEKALVTWGKNKVGPWLEQREQALTTLESALQALDGKQAQQRVLASGAMVAATTIERLKLADLLAVVLIVRDDTLVRRVDAALTQNDERRRFAIAECLMLPTGASKTIDDWRAYCARRGESIKSELKQSSAQRCADAASEEPSSAWQVKALRSACAARR